MTDKAVETTTDATPMVSVRGVHKFFGDLHVLRGIDLDIAPGEVCVILGPSGSGKSTLLRCLNLLEKISAGRVYVDGELLGYREYAGGALFERHDASVPLLGFGNVLWKGTREAIDSQGFLGLFTGGFKACAVGVSAALIFSYLASLIFKPKMKG